MAGVGITKKLSKAPQARAWEVGVFLIIYGTLLFWATYITEHNLWLQSSHKLFLQGWALGWKFLGLIFVVFPKAGHFFIRQFTTLKPFYWLVLVLVCLVAVNIPEKTIWRKSIFCLVFLLPVVLWGRFFLREFHLAQYMGKLGLALFAALYMAFSVPGVFLPPFYKGIGGWVKKGQLERDQYSFTSWRLVAKDGRAVWLPSTVIAPMYMYYHNVLTIYKAKNFARDEADYRVRKNKTQAQLAGYYFDIYRHHYSQLGRGIAPYKKYLGDFAMIEHHPTLLPDYKEFPPGEIQYVQRVAAYVNKKSGKISSIRIMFSHDVGGRK